MAVLTENFDSYSTGELNGTGSWTSPSGNNLFAITSTQSNTSPNSATLGATVPSNNICYKAYGSTTTSGNQQVKMRVDSIALNTDAFGIYLYSAAPNTNPATNRIGGIQIIKNVAQYDIKILDASTGFNTIFSNISTGSFHTFNIIFDTAGATYRLTFDGTSSASFALATSSGIADIGIFISTETGTNTFYIDSFSDGAAVTTVSFLPILGTG